MSNIKKTYSNMNLKTLNIFQYCINIILLVLFFAGLIPYYYDNISKYIFLFLGIQIFISLLRLRFINVILELIILGLSVLSIIPFAGYVFRIVAILILFGDIATFKLIGIYKKVNVVNINTFKVDSKKNKEKNFEEA